MAEIDLNDKFPDLRPINAPPSLFTLNGCGLVLYGNRDFDDETGTYIKTHCLAFLFLPLFSLGAYRVLDSEDGGWYFIGKEPLSGFARACNVIILAGIIGAIGIGTWLVRSNNPDNIAAKKLEEADELAAAEKWDDAAAAYLEVKNSNTKSSPKAQQRLATLIENACNKAPAEATLSLLRIGESLKLQGNPPAGLQKNAVAAANRLKDSNPAVAFEIVKLVEGLQLDANPAQRTDPKALQALKRSVLESLVKSDPENLVALGELAVFLERDKKIAECKKLLEPKKDRLGDTEGARVLGQIYAREGNIDGAHKLLVPYCKTRLGKLHALEERYNTAYDSIYRRLRAEIRQADKQQNPQGPHANFIRRLRNEKTKAGAQAAYIQYVNGLVRKDEALNRQLLELRLASGVVPVALDLGMVQLRRGQNLADPEKRKAELKKAEETFLAIRGVAGKTARYQLHLGQVYYWLGRQTEGKKLFDDLLAAQKRAPQILLTVAGSLRILGAESEARKLVDEAYRTATDDEQKYYAASLRARLTRDLDEKITWLERCDLKQPITQADLNSARGRKALLDGNDQQALTYYRKTAKLYGEMQQNTTSWNNGALAWLQIFGITGETSAFETASRLIEKAVTSSPTDAILVSNSASVLYSGASQAIIGKALDLSKLQTSASVSLLSYFYSNDEERKHWAEKVRNHAGIKKSLAYMNNAIVLAPKRTSNYMQLLNLYSFLRDDDAIETLLKRLRASNVDTSGSTKDVIEYIQGKDIDKLRKQYAAAIDRQRKTIERVKNSPPATRALADSSLAGQLMTLWSLDAPVDSNEVVRLAERALKAAPSSATSTMLQSALLFRGLMSVMEKNPQFAAKVKPFRRTLPPLYLLAVFLKHDPDAAKLLRANADIQRGVQLTEASEKAFAGTTTTSEWAIVTGFDPAKSDEYKARVLKNRRARMTNEFNRIVAPASASAAVDRYWELTIEGKPAEASRIVKDLKALGVTLPLVR